MRQTDLVHDDHQKAALPIPFRRFGIGERQARSLFGLIVLLILCGLALPELGAAQDAPAIVDDQEDDLLSGAQASSVRGVEEGLLLDDVVRQTIAQNWQIRTATAGVTQAEGAMSVASGAFDVSFNASALRQQESTLYTSAQQAQLGTSAAESAVSSYSLGIQKGFRSGLRLVPSLQVSRTDALTLEAAPVVRSAVDVSATYPVLRGRTVEAAREDASRDGVRASRMDLQHTIYEQLYAATAAYWAYRAAVASLDIYVEAEDRARKLLNDTRHLVEADERPRADLAQLEANLADKVAARVASEQRVFETRQRLGLAMSLSPSDVNALPAPSNPFPDAHGESIDVDGVLSRAFSERLDLHSARLRSRAAATLRDAERNDRRPRFDLQASVGYAGLSDGRLDFSRHLGPFGGTDASGATVSLGVVYRWAPSNRSARGAFEQQHAIYRQQEIRAAEVERQIQAGVTVAANRLRSTALELQSATSSVTLHGQTVDNERKKLRLGMSTLFDVTLAEDRLTTALLNRVSAQARYSQAVAQLRLETGLLPPADAEVFEIVDALTSLP